MEKICYKWKNYERFKNPYSIKGHSQLQAAQINFNIPFVGIKID